MIVFLFGNGLLISSLVWFFKILMPMFYFGVLWGILILWEWVWWVYRFNKFCKDAHGFCGCICVIRFWLWGTICVILWVVFRLLGLFFVAPVLCHSLVQWAKWSFVIRLYLVVGNNFLCCDNQMYVCACVKWEMENWINGGSRKQKNAY